MIRIKIKYIYYLLIAGLIYYIYQHVEIVETYKKRKLTNIVTSQSREGHYLYINYHWIDEDGYSYVRQHPLEDADYDLKIGKTYIYNSQALKWK